jgi:predicted nuclease of predicted toxin-antitoxin system
MKFLVDMNLSPLWVAFLGNAGFEAVHWSDVGAGDASDVQVLHWAAESHHVILTADLDFGAVLAAVGSKQPSVIQLRSDSLNPALIGPMVLTAVRQSREELLGGALISIDVARARVRILPLVE